MSRLDRNLREIEDVGIEENEYIHDDGIKNVLSNPTKREKRIVLWDADSLVHFVLYSGKDEQGNKNPEYTDEDLPVLKDKLNEMILKVLNNIEKYFDIKALYIFIKGKGNFRKDLYPEYKSNRKPKHPLIDHLYDHFTEKYDCCRADGAEAEDYVYTASREIGHEGIIVYVDHDLEEIPGLFYNYKKDFWLKITEKEALHNKYQKLCIGESGDFANFTPKIGIKYFEKNFSKDFTVKEYEEALFQAYMKAWKGDEQVATEKLALAKKILLLKDVDVSKTFNFGTAINTNYVDKLERARA